MPAFGVCDPSFLLFARVVRFRYTHVNGVTVASAQRLYGMCSCSSFAMTAESDSCSKDDFGKFTAITHTCLREHARNLMCQVSCRCNVEKILPQSHTRIAPATFNQSNGPPHGDQVSIPGQAFPGNVLRKL